MWWKGLFSWPRAAFTVATLVTLSVLFWMGTRATRPSTAEQLLAQAYTEHRTLELRMSGAKFGPKQNERGGEGSRLDKPPSLLKAEALIGENLGKSPNDPEWLRAKARADLLDGNYSSAAETLKRALETRPDSPDLLVDLGSAYYMQAEASGRTLGYCEAIEAFGRALIRNPNDPVAVFNRALSSEQLYLYTQAGRGLGALLAN